jgi:sporulation protein YlmC with PRC-barrel domain
MSETAEFDIGSEVACSDGVCGDLTRVVMDPVARAITHLVVEPRHGHGSGHLVPIDRVASTEPGLVRLACTKAQFGAFERAQDSELLPAEKEQMGYQPGQVLSLPYYELHLGSVGLVGLPQAHAHGRLAPHIAAYDHVPLGEVEVRRGEHVHATDGPIGRVKGLVIDPSDHHVTHFLLDEGHLWGQKTVAIPIGAVTRVGDGVRLSLAKDEVRDLPPVDVKPSE